MIPAEAIERVIDEFESRIGTLMLYTGVGEVQAGVAIRAYESAIKELRKVLNDYGRRQ